MKSLKIKTHQYYRKSELDKQLLYEKLPYCVKIVSSQEDGINDLMKLEFDRVNCIPLSEVITYSNLLLFSLTHGQVFSLIHKLLKLIENLKYENESLNKYHVWLIFDENNDQRLEVCKRSILNYELFYSFPLDKQDKQDKQVKQDKQDQTQILQLITQLLQLCKNIPQSFFVFDSNKPYKIYEKELKLGLHQFKEKFNEYYLNQKNIDQEIQMDLNIDLKDDDLIQNSKDIQKIEMFISEYIKYNYDMSPLDTILNELLKQYNLELFLRSLSMHQDEQKKKKFELKHFQIIFKFKTEKQQQQQQQQQSQQSYQKQLIKLISETFEELNKVQEILKNSIKYEDYQLNENELKDLYEFASVIYFKHQGYFNSVDQFIEIRQQIIDKKLIFEENFYYILKPIIYQDYNQIVELNILRLIDELI